MTALFVTVESVITRMQLQGNLEGLQEVVRSALKGAQLHIEAVLDTDLERKSQDCLFFLDSDTFNGIQLNGQYRLDLPSYFIREDTPVTLTYGDTWRTVDQAVDTDLMFIQRERGQIFLDGSEYKDKYVRVRCDTGFNPGTDLEVAEPIPDWLHEAILCYAGVVLDVSQTTNRAKDAKDIYQRAGDHAMVVLQPKMRKRGFTFRPFNS